MDYSPVKKHVDEEAGANLSALSYAQTVIIMSAECSLAVN